MPIRGMRSIWPRAGKPPTGIFSSRGKQKVDDTSHFGQKSHIGKNVDRGERSKPKGGSKSLRHQKPRTYNQQKRT